MTRRAEWGETTSTVEPTPETPEADRKVVATIGGIPLLERLPLPEREERMQEASNRVGIYLSELQHLDELDWGVRARCEPKGETGPAVTLEFFEPRFNSGSMHPCLSLPEGSAGRREVEYVIRGMFRRGTPLSYEDHIGAQHPLLLVFYAAWRDHYEGDLPPLFPFKRNGGLVS